MKARPNGVAWLGAAAVAGALNAWQVIFGLLASALLWMLLLVLAGLAAIVAGVFTIFGTGAALLAAGVACLILAALIFLGIRHA